MKRNKVVSAEDAVRVVMDGDTVATSGFVGIGFPEELALALERRFEETGAPKDLTLVYAAGPGAGGGGCPEGSPLARGRRFEETGAPKDLTLVYAAGQGDGGSRGLNHFAAEGMVRRIVGGGWGRGPAPGGGGRAGE